jgi:[ribosomal protein S18]-alanine N-acetyltransferase
MTARDAKKTTEFVIVWEFRVKPGNRRAFEKAHSPAGPWPAFFRRSAGYIRTELIRDRHQPLRYLTIDVWRSRQAYEQFKKNNHAKYQAMDKICESLHSSERLLGECLHIDAGDLLLAAMSPPSSRSSSGADPNIGAPYSIRAASAADVPHIIALERNAPSAAHWPESAYLQIFDKNSPPRIALLAPQAGNKPLSIRGFVIARLVGSDCELENIVVARPAQRHGLGSSLLKALASGARRQGATRIFLEVRESSTAARRLYEKCGFAITGRRPSYYSNPAEEAILYALSL